MNHAMMRVFLLFVCSSLVVPFPASSEEANEAIEPTVSGPGTIDLFDGATLDSWDVPSDRWYVDEESIVGDTQSKELSAPEWLYTKQRFKDFAFTCELKLTGDEERNTGIYYRVNTILFRGHEDEEEEELGEPEEHTVEGDEEEEEEDGWQPFEAPSGYEMDAFHGSEPESGEPDFWGSLGDWYKRPDLRIFADLEVIRRVLKSDDWNRLTIRARGNRLEHWINGVKVVDYVDRDPNASREGVIGFQIHDGAVMEVRCRNIHVLPIEP